MEQAGFARTGGTSHDHKPELLRQRCNVFNHGRSKRFVAAFYQPHFEANLTQHQTQGTTALSAAPTIEQRLPAFCQVHHFTIKVTGNSSWAWTWTYPKDEGGGFEFQARLLDQDTLAPGKLKLLDVDNEAVVPVNKTVRLQVTADVVGVIHGFVIPSFGVRIDAVPGRLNETWFKAEREGVYYGQCSKICGKDHAYMPVVIRVVSEEAYKVWLEKARKEYAQTESSVRVADASAAR